MRNTTNLFLIDNVPMLLPDAQVGMRFEDVDSADAGRDESGYMHRHCLRRKVGVWSFSYQHLTEQEKNYMEALFEGKDTFQFTHPDRLDSTKATQTQCYRSQYGISWVNAATGLWSGYGFQIIEC